MTVYALDIPDDPTELSVWLERHLVGLHLAELVAELEAVHGAPSDKEPTLDRVLGPSLDSVLTEGLQRVPRPALGRLLRHPRLLLELQDRVSSSGGEHWSHIAATDTELTGLVERDRPKLEAPEQEEPTVLNGLSARHAWYSRPYFTVLATAATLLTAFFVWDALKSAGSAEWGWNRPGVLTSTASPSAYLHGLAEAAEDWFRQGVKERPGDAVALARRIGDFRRGCTALILAPSTALAQADRDWLLKHCRDWAVKLDASLATVEALAPNKDPARVTEVRDSADRTIRALIKALHDKADSLS
jgi:hypothetical protein